MPSSTARDAGVFASYPKLWNRSSLHIGASPASVLFVVYLAEDPLLYCFLCRPLHDCPSLAFNLDSSRCTSSFLFPCDKVQSSPEVLLVLPLDNGADAGKCLIVVVLFLRPVSSPLSASAGIFSHFHGRIDILSCMPQVKIQSP